MNEREKLSKIIENFDLESYIHATFDRVISSKSDELRLNCFSPNGCDGSDKKGHLWVNIDKKVWICYKCKYGDNKIQPGTANLVRFIADAENIPYRIARERLLNQTDVADEGDLETLLEEAFEKLKTPKKPKVPLKISIPKQFHSLASSKGVTAKRFKNYAFFRYFDQLSQEQFDMRFCVSAIPSLSEHKNSFSNRIIWPIYDLNGVCRSAIGRSIGKHSDRRYINWPNTDLSDYLWPLGKIINRKFQPTQFEKTVILTEGIIDAFAVRKLTPYQAYACFGKKLSSSQARILEENNVKNVILAWDFEAKEQMKLASKCLLPKFEHVYVFPFKHPHWKFDDFGDVLNPKNELKNVINNEFHSSIDVLTPQFCGWMV